MKIAHLTSVHQRYDIRIFLKQCRSLAASGYTVSLVVADGRGSETRDDVQIIDAGASSGRFDRVLNATRRIFNKAVQSEADLYHFHDPELLLVGRALKKRGKRVVFDSHEDIPQDILTKPYIPQSLRPFVSKSMSVAGRAIYSRLDGVVAATPFIRDTFIALGVRSIDINNYPMLGELEGNIGWGAKKKEVCYVGGMAEIRGIVEMIDAFASIKSDVRLNLAGRLAGSDVDIRARQSRGWSRVNELGQIERPVVKATMARSLAGIITYKPGPNHLDAQPNKMFEYMSAGIPVIASNFPLWREIVEGNNCGIVVDPLDPADIARAIDYLAMNPTVAETMGKNGSAAARVTYNWDAERTKLVRFYKDIGAHPHHQFVS